MDRFRNILKNVLLAFILITIGFAIGKETTLRSAQRVPDDVSTKSSGGRPMPVMVYYLHATVRCDTCNSIERMTHNVLTSQFADALAAGQIEWKVADFQEDDELARRFKVVSSGVVVAIAGKGKTESYRTLDDVWTLVDDPAAFKKYIAEAVQESLAAASKEESYQ